MKTIHNTKRFTAVLLSILVLFSAFMPCVSAEEGSWIDESKLFTDRQVTSTNTYKLVGGLTERHVVFNNAKKNNQIKGYVMEVDINNPEISVIAGYNDGTTDEWVMSTVKSQTQHAEAQGLNVVGAVNGSGFNTSTGEPSDVLVMNGSVKHYAGYQPFFAILNDGTAVIRPAGSRTDDVKEAVSGMALLVVNGNVVDHTADPALHPRTAVGIKADGSLVFFVADGRQKPASLGMTYTDLAHTMSALGCVDAMALDGGGSSIMLTQREGTDDLGVRNVPSYAGIERPVATSLMICTTAKPTNEYDHVAFSVDKIFVAPLTPASFSVIGVDKYGYEAGMPEDGYLELADSSLGSISGTTFMSGTKTGKTTINYIVDGEVAASLPVEVSNDADNLITAAIKKIMQAFANIFNLLQTFMEKMNERI